MSPWTALLESLHSALIDELNERLPDHKPELGMPQRHRQLVMPAADLSAALICEITFAIDSGETRGFAMLASDSSCDKKLKLNTQKLWDALIKRAGREFMFRNIKPRLGDVKELKGTDAPSGFATPGRVVWIPFRLHPGCCYLGVGA